MQAIKVKSFIQVEDCEGRPFWILSTLGGVAKEDYDGHPFGTISTLHVHIHCMFASYNLTRKIRVYIEGTIFQCDLHNAVMCTSSISDLNYNDNG